MSQISDRKLKHINIVLNEDVEPQTSSFDAIKLPFKALPEIDMAEISTEVDFLGKKISFPFIISSMTGGEEKGEVINKNLAIAAEEMKVPLGLGSMRVVLVKPDSFKTFDIRKYCPTVPLFANIGLVQLNYGYGVDEINKLIDLIEGDGIFLHINALQEAVQPEGDTNFKDLLSKLEKILLKIKGKVIIKEVGNGIDFETAKKLKEIGVDFIDVAGLGGTSWPWVEGYRRDDDLGYIFRNEGIPSVDSIIQNLKINGLNLIAGGGIRNGIHIAKALYIGAKFATAAKPFLEPALESPEKVVQTLKKFKKELEVAMFMVGAQNIEALSKL